MVGDETQIPTCHVKRSQLSEKPSATVSEAKGRTSPRLLFLFKTGNGRGEG